MRAAGQTRDALPAGDATLLALVHDRLGESGLYALIDDHGSITASALGIDVPVEEARRIALHGTPYGAGPLTAFESFADAIASGHDRAAAKADELHDRDHSLWAATGYGSLLSRPDDTLAARVGAGEFSRARQQSEDHGAAKD
ncbi:hypothetical protein [Streptomyces sp. NPDC014744]